MHPSSLLASERAQKFLSLPEALEKDYPTLKELVGQHITQRRRKVSPLITIFKDIKEAPLSQSLLEIHARGEHLSTANSLVENSLLAGKNPLEIFKASEKYPGILKWLLTVPLSEWPTSSDAHFFLAWIFNQADRGFDLAFWLERWFESNFHVELDAAFKAKNEAFLEYSYKMPCDISKSISKAFRNNPSIIIEYDAVSILATFDHQDLVPFSEHIDELLNRNALKVIRHLKDQHIIQSLTMDQINRAIRGGQLDILKRGVELGRKLEVADVVVALQGHARSCVQYMEAKMPGITLKGIFHIGMCKCGPISVEVFQTANIKFSQDDLTGLGMYLSTATINYIYGKQKILPNYPENEGSSC